MYFTKYSEILTETENWNGGDGDVCRGAVYLPVYRRYEAGPIGGGVKVKSGGDGNKDKIWDWVTVIKNGPF